MTTDEFATKLEMLAPSDVDLQKLGLNLKEAERFRAGYRCRRIVKTNESNPLFDLCNNFDVSSLEISVVTFCKSTRLDDDHWKIGNFEDDMLVLAESTQRVIVLDHEEVDRELCKCADTAAGFLEALLIVAESNTQTFRQASGTIPKPVDFALSQCVSLAGKDTQAFYVVLLGVNE